MTLADLLPFLQPQLMLALAFACMALILLGGALRETVPALGVSMRFVGNLILGVGFVVTMMELFQMGQFQTAKAAPIEMQAVTGDETRVPMSSDGHFWVEAEANGISRRFLVDTGATLTTLTPDTAEQAGVHPRPDGRRVVLNTANGSATGAIAAIETLKVGNVVARNLDSIVAPGVGETNVLGMNFLSGLASWRVEGRTMILVPGQGQLGRDD